MEAEEALIGVIDLQPREITNSRRALIWLQPPFALAFVVAFGSTLQTAISHLQSAQQSSQWDDQYWSRFLEIIAGSLQSVLMLASVVLVPLMRISAKQLAGGALALRAAAAVRDSRLAPVAETLSRALEQELVPNLPAQFEPLHRPNRALASDEALSGAFLLILGAVFLPVPVVIAMTPMTAHGGDWQLVVLVVCCAAIGVAAAAFGVVFLRQAWRMRRPQMVTADDLGLHWTRFYPRRREMHIPWSEIRSFFTVMYLSGLATTWAFVIDGREAALAWQVQPGMKDDILLASDQLSRLVLTRTDVPLLDLLKAADLAGTSRTDKRYAEAVELFGAPNSAGGPLWPGMPRPVTRRRLALAIAIVCSPLLLLAIFYMLGQVLQRAQMP